MVQEAAMAFPTRGHKPRVFKVHSADYRANVYQIDRTRRHWVMRPKNTGREADFLLAGYDNLPAVEIPRTFAIY